MWDQFWKRFQAGALRSPRISGCSLASGSPGCLRRLVLQLGLAPTTITKGCLSNLDSSFDNPLDPGI